MVDALVILAILLAATFLLIRQFRKGCGCDSNGSGPSCCND